MRSAVFPAALYCALAAVALAGLAAIIERLSDVIATDVLSSPKLAARPAKAVPTTTTLTTGRLVPTSEEFSTMLRDPNYWAKRRNGGNSGNTSARSSAPREAPSRLGGDIEWVKAQSQPPSSQRWPVTTDDEGDDGEAKWRSPGGGTFRTVCVRLCDGFHSPLSFSTTRDKLERDADRCEASCGGQARMFYYENPGSDVADMEDMDGNSYKKLKTAFLYRTSYNAQCTCRPQPWSQEAREAHRLYALQDAKSKGDKAAGKEADELAKRLKKAEVDAVTERKAAEKAAKKAEADAAAERKAADKAARKAKAAETKGKSKHGVTAAKDPVAPTAKELIKASMTLAPLPAEAAAARMSRAKAGYARSLAPAAPGQRLIIANMPAVSLPHSQQDDRQAGAAKSRVRSADATPRLTAYGKDQSLTPVRH